MPNKAGRIPIAGYANRFSARPGETIEFKVSSFSNSPYTTRLTRVINADPNPEGMGLIELPCDQWYTQTEYPSRVQPFFPGSFAISDSPLELQHLHTFRFGGKVWLRKLVRAKQVIVSAGNLQLGLTDSGMPYCDVSGQRR